MCGNRVESSMVMMITMSVPLTGLWAVHRVSSGKKSLSVTMINSESQRCQALLSAVKIPSRQVQLIFGVTAPFAAAEVHI